MQDETGKLITNSHHLAKIRSKLVMAKSVQDYKGHHVPVQGAALRDDETFQDVQKPAPERNFGEEMDEMDSILL